jgi:hypothetical protein
MATGNKSSTRLSEKFSEEDFAEKIYRCYSNGNRPQWIEAGYLLYELEQSNQWKSIGYRSFEALVYSLGKAKQDRTEEESRKGVRSDRTYGNAHKAFKYLVGTEYVQAHVNIMKPNERQKISEQGVSVESFLMLERLGKKCLEEAEKYLPDVLDGRLTDETLRCLLEQQCKITDKKGSILNLLIGNVEEILKSSIGCVDDSRVQAYSGITLYLSDGKKKIKPYKMPLIVVAQPKERMAKSIVGVEIIRNKKDIRHRIWDACQNFFHYYLIAIPSEEEELISYVRQQLSSDSKSRIGLIEVNSSISSSRKSVRKVREAKLLKTKSEISTQDAVYRTYASIYHHSFQGEVQLRKK